MKEFNKWIEEVRKLGWKPGLSRVKELLNRLDNPQNKLDIIHISGTNGKGSTATLLANILIEAGYKTGQFSTPSILGFNDMFRVDNQAIDDVKLLEIVDTIKLHIQAMLDDGFEHPTEYEIIASIMYLYFYEVHVDFAVVEVAMGGENDCTNVMDHTILSIMTPISLDHSSFLGDTLEEIAKEKSGIVKKNSVLITHPQTKEVMEVLTEDCSNKCSVMLHFESDVSVNYVDRLMHFDYEGLHIKSRLLGVHQASNILHVMEAVRNLNSRGYVSITGEVIKKAVEATVFPGRFESIGNFILDGAHNNASLIALSKTLEDLNMYNLTGVIGVLKDKDINEGLLALKKHFKLVHVTEPFSERKMSKDELADQLKKLGYPVGKVGSLDDICSNLGNEIIIGFGSFYMISELRKIISSND